MISYDDDFVMIQRDEATSKLRLRVIAGHQLAKKDIFGASDPYVRVDLNTINGDQTVDSALTRTKKKTLNPVWEEEFVFRVSSVLCLYRFPVTFNLCI